MFPRLVFVVVVALLWTSEAQVGWNVNFGFQKNPLPPSKGIAILKQLLPSWNYAKTFDYNATVLAALYANGITNIVVGVPNSDLPACANSGSPVATNIVQSLKYLYTAGVQLTIAVGNEPTINNAYSQYIFPALQNFRGVLSNNYMNNVQLTVPLDGSILATSYPPSQATLAISTAPYVVAIANFLYNDRQGAGSPFFVNLYPFFSLVDDPIDISVQYATLQTGLTASDGIYYPNMLAAMVAAVRAALAVNGAVPSAATIKIVVGETGWPTCGNVFATVPNAQAYVNNAIASGIPMYLFEAFDELLKTGGSGSLSSVEPCWGWNNESGVPKYPINWPGACNAKFPPSNGEYANLACPPGTLASWLQTGGCVQDPVCSIITCPGVPQGTVLNTCTRT